MLILFDDVIAYSLQLYLVSFFKHLKQVNNNKQQPW